MRRREGNRCYCRTQALPGAREWMEQEGRSRSIAARAPRFGRSAARPQRWDLCRCALDCPRRDTAEEGESIANFLRNMTDSCFSSSSRYFIFLATPPRQSTDRAELTAVDRWSTFPRPVARTAKARRAESTRPTRSLSTRPERRPSSHRESEDTTESSRDTEDRPSLCSTRRPRRPRRSCSDSSAPCASTRCRWRSNDASTSSSVETRRRRELPWCSRVWTREGARFNFTLFSRRVVMRQRGQREREREVRVRRECVNSVEGHFDGRRIDTAPHPLSTPSLDIPHDLRSAPTSLSSARSCPLLSCPVPVCPARLVPSSDSSSPSHSSCYLFAPSRLRSCTVSPPTMQTSPSSRRSPSPTRENPRSLMLNVQRSLVPCAPTEPLIPFCRVQIHV